VVVVVGGVVVVAGVVVVVGVGVVVVVPIVVVTGMVVGVGTVEEVCKVLVVGDTPAESVGTASADADRPAPSATIAIATEMTPRLSPRWCDTPFSTLRYELISCLQADGLSK